VTINEPLLSMPLPLRGVSARNRVVISPMLQYSARDGLANDWHFTHLTRFAIGGAGIVFCEATAVEERGRITHGDLGLWRNEQVQPLRRIARFIKECGALPAIQLAHAGRKAGTQRPWEGHGPLSAEDSVRGEPPWQPIAPSPVCANPARPTPSEIAASEIPALLQAWKDAAERAMEAEFDVVEIHAAHGYLLHTFLSGSSNLRDDAYGKDFNGRSRLLFEVAEIVRTVWPKNKPVFVRLSSVDEGGWTIEETIRLALELKQRGVDVIDCSSGSLFDSSTANVRLKRGYGYQVPFAAAVRLNAKVTTMAVGLIVDPHHAEQILQAGEADLIAIGREALHDPNWAVHALTTLSQSKSYASWPVQHGWWLSVREKIFERIRADQEAGD
jgi:2,4-dienoyl-CoA reductase-like NADH-dependent reductase (Old Yellow Enzyme family)